MHYSYNTVYPKLPSIYQVESSGVGTGGAGGAIAPPIIWEALRTPYNPQVTEAVVTKRC